MESTAVTPPAATGLDPRWRNLPKILISAGALLGFVGVFMPSLRQQFAHSYLLAFMFFLSICLGGLFLTIIHHLFDANWSVPIRRVTEHIAFLLPVMAALFIPIAVLAPKIYPWFTMNPPDHALHAKSAMLNPTFFYIRVVAYFLIWIVLSRSLRASSVAQDKDGAAKWTDKMRFASYIGMPLFAITVTFAVIDWMKSLQHQWFSTMYGVCYFAGSVWLTLTTVYVIAMILRRMGPLTDVLFPTHFYYIGSLIFAFTVFYAYVTFSQYFIIWNANMPEETFWYRLRERGTWW